MGVAFLFLEFERHLHVHEIGAGFSDRVRYARTTASA